MIETCNINSISSPSFWIVDYLEKGTSARFQGICWNTAVVFHSHVELKDTNYHLGLSGTTLGARHWVSVNEHSTAWPQEHRADSHKDEDLAMWLFPAKITFFPHHTLEN